MSTYNFVFAYLFYSRWWRHRISCLSDWGSIRDLAATAQIRRDEKLILVDQITH